MTEPPYSWSSPGGEPVSPPPAYGQPAYGEPPQGFQYGQPAWVQPGVVPLRPLAMGEILDGAIKVIRRYPKPTLGLSAAIALVVTALNVIAVLLVEQRSFTTGGDELAFSSKDVATSLAAAIPAALISFVAGLVLTGALITVVGRAVRGLAAPLDEVWDTVRPRLWALLGLALLGAIIVAGPLVAAVALGVSLALAGGGGAVFLGVALILAGLAASAYLYVRLSLSTPALVLEKVGITEALRRSTVLAKGSWWRIAGILLLAAIITSIVGAILAVPLGILGAIFLSETDGAAFLIAQQVASGIGSVLIAPFGAGVTALLYVDRRMRAEGLDVALRAAVDQG